MSREEGYKNLVPISHRTKDEQRKIQSDGGVASGAARRRKRALREAADLYLSLPVRDGRKRNALLRDGLDPDDVDNQMAMIVGLTKAAQLGEAKAAKLLFELIDEGGPGDPSARNNLLEAIQDTEEIDTDDLPEVE